ncbi:MAG: UDP-N-acetylmuramate--L-alanine ligase [Candidatus Firestonebacteria bacterium RIFOXYC2_FULL_39_67]|nr:MAG: UDP-N-acetylmuramate--L-alanine ligase [Candidatus Firestonebacteria bacterium RIFOXYD2_FULL_39_29]OGF55487.1 MAG: UDP-N-acetylmuramate--L-alanine ligase [Candidatus Firestonebacteria bacterium RifOxyC12_full_39_7]OGF56123.1 MAG: UDP-N-acetylmuramate--L-alanine ligase [Candidatus Firestonebacteria bacterium RIFOXYC2_FULL_39_67]
MNKKTYKAHFVGIGGIGMSGIAEVLINLGYGVSGSDVKNSEIVENLKTKGASVNIGHAGKNVADAAPDVVVISSAVLADNPEVVEAKKRNIPVIPRAEILAELMRLKTGIAIAGTHGKTTTTSMAAVVWNEAGLDPTIVIGGKLNVINSNAKLGKGEYLVAEADESDGSFMHLSPVVIVVTNIDDDHLDFHHSMENLKHLFISFINKVPFYGVAVLCADDDNVRSILPSVEKKYITYAIKSKADITLKKLKVKKFGSEFEVLYRGKNLGKFVVNVPGVHNVLNALAVIGAAVETGIKPQAVKKGLAKFTGVMRRFEKLGEKHGVLVVDDYGHHPTEIMATLKAARMLKPKRLIAVFQPHRYSRTRILFEKFGRAFKEANMVVLTDIYAAGEKPIPNVTAELVANSIKNNGKKVVFIKNKEDIPGYLLDICRKGDLIIILGAGDIRKTGEDFAKRLIKS